MEETMSKIKDKKNSKNLKTISRILIISAGIITVFMFSFAAFKTVSKSMENTEGKRVVEETKTDETLRQKQENDYTESEIVNNEQEKLSVSNNAYLDVKWIPQNPELPTGCEITSLTTVLQYYGYSVSKTTMASQYLDKGWGSFFETFIGDPFSENGYGCMSKPIVNAANKYFTGNNINAYAQNVSGSEFTDLLGYVAGGDPVVIWNTMYMEKPYISESWYYNGEMISWVAPEHCVVLIGYDTDKGKVYVSDPLEGIVTRDMNLFSEYYEAVYSQAVVIQR